MLATQTLDELQALRLEGMAQAPTEQRQQNDLAAFSFEDRLALLVERQWLWRENRSLAIRLKIRSSKSAPAWRIWITAARAA